MKRTCLTAMAAILALSLVSCGKQGAKQSTSAKEPVVAFVTNNVSNFWMIAKAGIRQGEKDFRVKCLFQMPAQGTPAEQKTILEDLLVKGVTGIAVSPVNPANQTADLNKVAGSVNLICMDSDAPQTNRRCYVGTDNYKAGKVAGEEIKKALPNGGKVMLFVGTLSADNAKQRRQGILDAIKGTKVQVIGTQLDNTDHTKAKSNVEDTLVKYQDVACLVGLWSYNGPAIAEAVKAAGKQDKVKIVCFDEDSATLQAVKDGVVFSTVVQKPYEFGYQSMKVLAALAKGEDAGIPASKIVDVPVEVISKANVDAFWKQLNERVGKNR